MRNRKLMFLVALLAAFSLLAAACGDDDDDTTATDDGGDDAAEPADDGGDDAAEPSDDGEEPMDDGGDASAADVPSSPDDGVTDDVIKVGWMGDLTGPTASSQVGANSGADAYFECLNERGGLFGRQIEYLAEDDQYSAETAAVNFTKLTQDDNVLALLSLNGSHIATQLAPQVADLSLPVIGALQTIDIQFDNPQFFNTLAHYGDMADMAIVQIEADLGSVEDAVVAGISLEVPSGQEYQAYIQQEIEERGGTYTTALFMAPGATEVTAQMLELQRLVDEEGVNYVTLHGSAASALVALQGMSDAGLTELPVVGNQGVAIPTVFSEGPADVVDQVYGAHSFLAPEDSPMADEMVRCAELAGHTEDLSQIIFTQGWVSAMVFEEAAIRAVEQTGELTRETLTEALRGTFDPQGLTCPIDWSDGQHSPCAAAFTAGDADYLVPANPFDFYADALDGEYGIEF